MPPLHAWLVSFFSITILARANYLLPVLIAGLLIGEPLARLLRFPALRASIGAPIATLGHKLNRPNRSIATRLYRGIVALIMLLIPAIALGLILMRPNPQLQIVTTIFLTALIGDLTQPYTAFRQRRAARNGTLALQSADPHYLFADTHGQLRYLILRYAKKFRLLVGACFWYLLADMPGLLAYLTLAAAAAYYDPAHPQNRAFGWAAHVVNHLGGVFPALLGAFLLTFAALFVPKAAPIRALTGPFLANLLGLSLGGPMPTPAGERHIPWSGQGNPKASAADFSRLLQLLLVAILLLLLTLYAVTHARQLCVHCMPGWLAPPAVTKTSPNPA